MNKELFRELYVAHSKPIFSFLLGRTNDKELAADLLQDVFLKVWNRIEIVAKIPDVERLYWIFSVASNRWIDHIRRSSHQKKVEVQLRTERISSNGDLSSVLAGRERFRHLEAHINDLPEELRCILLMKVLGGLNSVQIGVMMSQPPGTIRYKILQSRRLLAEKMKLLDTVSTGTGRNLNV
jgi:RNA polymerase sigma factor (sigma-70 family)